MWISLVISLCAFLARSMILIMDACGLIMSLASLKSSVTQVQLQHRRQDPNIV